MKVLFAGSPAIAIETLKAISEDHEVVGILTNPDSKKGRGRSDCCTELASAAALLCPQAPIFKFEHLRTEEREQIAKLKADILVVFAYGKVFGPKFLALFPYGGINVHPSLLPKYRGCAPIPYSILNMDAESAVSIQKVALELDSGEIYASEIIPLTFTETTDSLSETASLVGARLTKAVLKTIKNGSAIAKSQDHTKASYTKQLEKEDGKIDFTRSAREIDAQIRAFQSWPCAFTFFHETRLNIIKAVPYTAPFSEKVDSVPNNTDSVPNNTDSVPNNVDSVPQCGLVLGIDKKAGILVQTGRGILALQRLQLESKKPLDFKDFLNGVRDFIGSTL